jgi:hypothetical protein
MKQIGLTAVLIALAVGMCMPGTALSVNDTLVVYATPLNLEVVINSDTTSGGMQAHKVYKLVSLDSTYVFQGPITVKSDITVIGQLDPVTHRPPCVQPMTLPNISLPDFMFVLTGVNTKAVFKDLYLSGRSTDNTLCTTNYNGAGAIIQLAAEGIRLTVDNVVFVDWPTNNIGYSGDHCSIFVTNCKFRNAIISTAWYSGEAVRNTFNTAITDTLVMKYNTMFCIAYSAACPVTVNPCSYFEFDHNSVIYTFKNPFWIFNVTNARVNNNLFYAAFSGASNTTEHFGMWDQLRSFEITGMVDFDTLNMPIARWFDPADTAGSSELNILWPAEAKRNIEVKNNVCFWPQGIKNLWTAWNDTAHVDTIITPVWMNARTLGMFADKTHWPAMAQSGNLDVDPLFGPSIDAVMDANTQSGDGFVKYFGIVRSNSTDISSYGYKVATVSGDNWRPEWPLPELADMQYQNVALRTGGTDGKPIGDPGWFTGGITGVTEQATQLPDHFSLSEAYPNPFNPATKLGYTVGVVGGRWPVAGSHVRLVVYDLLGREVATLVDEVKAAGTYQVAFDGAKLASGVYLCRMTAGNFVDCKKLVLLK